MVSCSIFSSREAVFKSLLGFLKDRSYRKIQADTSAWVITAQRRDSLFSKMYSVRFEVASQASTVSDIQITVNPHHPVSTERDIKLEDKIRSRIYFYF